MIRMIVTDLDGTLLDGRGELPDENLRALKRAMAAGGRVVLATGRMPEATLPLAEAIGVNAPLMLFNGGMAYDARRREVLSGVTIDRDTAVRILRVVEAEGVYVHASLAAGYCYARYSEKWTAYFENKIRVKGREVGMPLSEWLREGVYKLLCLDEPERLDALMEKLRAMFPEVNIVKSAKTHLEIVRRDVDKARGLQIIGELTGVKPEEMLCFGDEMNDLPMLRCAGTSYVMANAPADMLKAADHIAPANTEHGVADVVNRYLDEGKMGE